MKKLNQLETKLGIKFKNQSFLSQALVHRSYLNEAPNKGLESNERLEFLGDAILEFIVSRWLFEELPEYPEGDLTNLRSNLVKTDSLAKISQKLEVGKYLLLSRGEKASDGQKNPSLLANALEAIIGAVFLDQGVETAKKFVRANLKPLFKQLLEQGEFKDYKSLLQEKIQAKTKKSPAYRVIREQGLEHVKTFTIGVYSQNRLLATGKGKSKQAAEQKAAKLALDCLTLNR